MYPSNKRYQAYKIIKNLNNLDFFSFIWIDIELKLLNNSFTVSETNYYPKMSIIFILVLLHNKNYLYYILCLKLR